MKKWALRILVAAVVLVVLIVVAVGLFLDSGIKKGVETVGPMLTKVQVKLDSASLSLLSGSGTLKGLFVGNPEGFKTASAIQVGTAALAIQTGSLLSDKVVIRSINVEGPEITFETDLKSNNLSKILENLQAATGGSDTNKAAETKTREADKASKKLQVDDFRIAGAKLHVSVTALGGKSVTVPLPEIHLTELGKGPDGITAADLTKQILQAIEKEAVQASATAVADLSKQAKELAKGLQDGLQQSATGAVNKVTEGVGNLFKKKK